MDSILYMLGLILVPFNDIDGFGFLGELKSELSAYIFLLLFALAFFALVNSAYASRAVSTSHWVLPQPTFRIIFFFLVIVVISFGVNFPQMWETFFRERHAVGKWATSTMVLLYGFAITIITHLLSRSQSWHKMIVQPIAASVLICAFFCAIEALAVYAGGFMETVQSTISLIIHGNSIPTTWNNLTEDWWSGQADRLRSVCFEPPALATFAGFVLPWLGLGILTRPEKSRHFYILTFFIACLLILAANSRTGIVLLVGNVSVFLFLRFAYLPPKRSDTRWDHMATAFLFVGTIVAAIAFWSYSDDLLMTLANGGGTADDGREISNLSRLASNVAALRMFSDSPIWGFGFGQYGFHAATYMPSWGWYSPEINYWFYDVTATWPPVFSIYARVAAELGLVGLVFWVGLWLFLARSVLRAARYYQERTGVLLIHAYPLIMSCYCVLFSGLSVDTLRFPLLWVTLGLSCSFLEKVKTYIQEDEAIKAQAKSATEATKG